MTTRRQPAESKSRRLVVNDATFESLRQTMSENPAGILAIKRTPVLWVL